MPTVETTKTECPVCKRPVNPHHMTMSVHGVTFHSYCAGYKRKAQG